MTEDVKTIHTNTVPSHKRNIENSDLEYFVYIDSKKTLFSLIEYKLAEINAFLKKEEVRKSYQEDPNPWRGYDSKELKEFKNMKRRYFHLDCILREFTDDWHEYNNMPLIFKKEEKGPDSDN